MTDSFQRVIDLFAARDAATAAEHGCPLATVDLDGRPSCEKASAARLEASMAGARSAAVLKAATPVLLPARRRKHNDGGFDIHLSAEEFHELSDAIDRLRER